MSLSVNVWSKVKVFVESAARGTALTISGISKANPAVITYTGTDPSNGDIMLLKVSGMSQLDYRLVRVANVNGAGNTFEAEGIDSSSFDDFISGTAEKVTMAAGANTFQDISWSGGDAAAINIATIHQDQDFEVPGNFAPLVANIGSLWDPADPALLELADWGAQKLPCALEIRFATGARVFLMATPSASLAPSGNAGGAVTTPVSIRARGRLTAYSS